MAKKILITGGIKSGKSDYALEMAKSCKDRKLFVATARAFDDEMKEKIKKHRLERGDEFETIEEPVALGKILENENPDLLIIDCVTLWLSNLFFELGEDKKEAELKEFLKQLGQFRGDIIIITNEVGGGIVPENKLSREYQSELGKLNQEIAGLCDEVYLMVSGVAMRIK